MGVGLLHRHLHRRLWLKSDWLRLQGEEQGGLEAQSKGRIRLRAVPCSRCRWVRCFPGKGTEEEGEVCRV